MLFYVPARIVVEADGPKHFYLDSGFCQGKVVDNAGGNTNCDVSNDEEDGGQNEIQHRYCIVQVQLQCSSKEAESAV